MSDIMLPALQKYYSALSSLERFNKEKNFFDNISSLDNFFSEYRNITFVLQKSIAHTEFKTLYEKNRNKYLSSCKWLLEKRNEITKEHPFQLVKQIEISVFLPYAKIQVLSKVFTIENDIELDELLQSLKNFLSDIHPVEVFFSSKFSFYDKVSEKDVYDEIIMGLQSMSSFLTSMYQDIGESNNLSEEIIKKIKEFNFSKIPKDMLLTNDYVYYPQKNIFDKSDLYAMRLGDNAFENTRIPLSCLNANQVFTKFGEDHFKKFVLLNVLIGETDLMPTFLIVFSDNTFEIDSFNGGLKTTIYRKIHEIASRIHSESITKIFFMITYSVFPANDYNLQITSKERLGIESEDVLTFAEITDTLCEREYTFEQSKIKNQAYILQQLITQPSKLNISKTNMHPIVEAFRTKNKK